MFIMAIRPIFNRTLNTYLAISISGLSSETAGKIEPKIVGGYDASIEQVSYQVSIRLTANDRKSYGSGHLCGGVVISQRLVATAAHCCYMCVLILVPLSSQFSYANRFRFPAPTKRSTELLANLSWSWAAPTWRAPPIALWCTTCSS